MTDGPDFGRLVDEDALTSGEAERLRRVHDLLVAAGPPAELPASLGGPPRAPRARVVVLSRRRAGVAVGLAAALAAASFALGTVVGDSGPTFETWRGPISMHGASGALATLRIAPVDAGGNWQVLLTVSGLPPLPQGATYDLVLTRGDELGPTCGSFVVDGETTAVTMNAPWSLRRWTGWVIVRRAPGEPTSAPILST